MTLTQYSSQRQAPNRKLSIPADSRAFIVGTAGSGKSYLSWALLAKARRLIQFDVNGTLYDQTGNWRVQPYQRGIKDLVKGKDVRLRVPPLDSEEEYDEIFSFILRNVRYVTLYFDEITGLGKQRGSVPLRRLYQQGRAKHIGLFCSTQRPKDIPSVLLSETPYKIMFQLRLERDLEAMEEMFGGRYAERANGELIAIDDLDFQKHDFVVATPENRYPQYFRRVQVQNRIAP